MGDPLTSDGVWVYSYDDEGNIAQKERISDGVTWHYGWDHRNQLTWAEERDDGNDLLMRVEYRYDAWGNRIEKNVDWNADEVWDTTQRYVLDGWNPVKPNPVGNENWDVLLDLDDSNTLETRYLRGDVVDELFGRVEEGEGYWTLLDHQGSVRDVLGESGSWLASVQYDAFGNVVARFDGGGDPLPESDYGYLGRYGWTGRERDAETGLQYNRARYYDPRTGRWFSQDPLGFAAGDANLYRYVGNKTTWATDPSGLEVKLVLRSATSSGDLGGTPYYHIAVVWYDSNGWVRYDGGGKGTKHEIHKDRPRFHRTPEVTEKLWTPGPISKEEYQGGWYTVNYGKLTATEQLDALDAAYYSIIQVGPYPTFGIGPNSNTYARRLLEEAGFSVMRMYVEHTPLLSTPDGPVPTRTPNPKDPHKGMNDIWHKPKLIWGQTVHSHEVGPTAQPGYDDPTYTGVPSGSTHLEVETE